MFGNVTAAFILTCLAGFSTLGGSLIAYFIKEPKFSYLSLLLGLSAGVMIYVSFVELLNASIEAIGYLKANIGFFGGILGAYGIDLAVPHAHIDAEPDPHYESLADQKKLAAAGVLTAVGITIHNFPEGMAVFAVSLESINLGIPIAFAIAVHNVPEGIAVSIPIYYATGNQGKAFLYSAFSGAAEPLGAIVGYLILLPFLTETVLHIILAVVGGIMIFICFDELLPISRDYGNEHLSTLGIFVGMVVMMLSLSLF